MNLEFDWIGNPKVALNVFISALIIGGIAFVSVWASLPENATARPALVAGLVAISGALKERLSKKPQDLLHAEQRESGTAPDRRG